MSTPKAKRQPLSDKHRLIIIITAIVLAAVIAVSITLGVMLKEPTKTPDTNDPSNSASSNLPVKNGDFGLTGSDETTYPKSATNWTRYGYKAPSGSSHDFEPIESTENVVMGIVDTDEEQWTEAQEDLKVEGVTLGTNPKQHSLPEGEKHTNSNVYMIAAKNATNAAIMSDSVSVSATTSVKITVWINTSQLSEGGATVMIQNSSSTPNAKEDNRYAYKYDIKTENDWQKLEFHVFNRKTSTQYIRVCVGIGNVYTDAPAQGIVYVDDISYETVTADDYRLRADNPNENDTMYKIIEKEEETTTPAKSSYMGLKPIEGTTISGNYTNADAYATVAGYSPFTNKDDFYKDGEEEGSDRVETGFGITMIKNDGKIKTPVALELEETIKLSLNENDYTVQDYNHVSFWVRTKTLNDNALAYANILVQRQTEDGWESLTNGDFTTKTAQDIKTDTNNGWTKYDIYLKPAKAETVIRIVFALGDIDGYKAYEEQGYVPEGELYVTTPYFETISSSAYTSASSSTASLKFDLTGSTATTSITNGSFSSIAANTKQPTGWTPVFAGDNNIYLDGKGDLGLGELSTDKAAVAGSGVVDWKSELGENSGYVDDDEGRILKLISRKDSSYGFISGDISVSAHTVYVFSVMVNATKGEGSTPYFYLLDKNLARENRENAIVAKVEHRYVKAVDGELFNQPDSSYGENSGWECYYIVYVTGDEDTTLRLALFNGSMTNANECAKANATIYYDNVTMQTLGTYALVEDEDNKEATEYVVKFNAANDYEGSEFAKCENIDQLVAKMEEVFGNNAKDSVSQPSNDEWTEMKKIPEPKDEEEEEEEPETPAEPRDVNLALLFSILSSVLLIAALAVVVVLKIFKQRKRNS